MLENIEEILRTKHTEKEKEGNLEFSFKLGVWRKWKHDVLLDEDLGWIFKNKSSRLFPPNLDLSIA